MNLIVKIGGDSSGLNATVARIKSTFAGLSSSIYGGVGNRLAGIASAAGVQMMIQRTVEYAGKLTDMSQQTGVSVEALQRLDRAAKENGTSIESLISLWDRLNTARNSALKDPKGSQALAFQRLGVSQPLLKTEGAEGIMRQIAVAFRNTTNVEELVAPLREIGGRGATEMIALFRAGLDQQYRDMQVMTGEQAALLDELDDKWQTFGRTLSIGFAPVLVWLIDKIRSVQNFWEKLTGAAAGAGSGFYNGTRRNGFWNDIAEGMEAGWKVTSSEIADQIEKESKERAAKVKRALSFGKPDFYKYAEPSAGENEKPKSAKNIADKSPVEAEPPMRLDASTMAQAGLFGSSDLRFNPVGGVLNEQLTVLREIAGNTRDAAPFK